MSDFATLTNAQLNRWAAERDGFKVVTISDNGKGYGQFELQQHGEFYGPYTHEYLSDAWLAVPKVADRADLAIALLCRWGYRWMRYGLYNDLRVTVYSANNHCTVYESPECDTARALVIAANSLKESEEG